VSVVASPRVTFPVTFAEPVTDNVFVGELVPIPTLPSESMVMRAAGAVVPSLVRKIKSVGRYVAPAAPD
jgi:hypothetical protein